MKSGRSLSITFVLALAVGGCSKEQPAPPPPPPPPVAAAPAAPEPPKSDPACVGPITTGTPETVAIGGVDWELNGSTLTQKSPAANDTIVIGAISDIKEDSEENHANVTRFADWFKKSKVSLIIVSGDTGQTEKEIESSISVLAGVEVPVLVIIGNREGRKVFTAAMESLRQKHKNVFSLNTVRRVDTPQVDVISMPGYFNPNYIHAEDGCPYQPADVAALAPVVAASNSPTLLVSHGGPKQEGPLGIDYTSEGDNVGDPELTKLIREAKIPFGIFGNIHEAGGHATDLAGKIVIKEREPADSLYLHPGPADAVRWGMNDKTESLGMASLLTIEGGKAQYEVMRMEDPEKKAAGRGKGKKAK